MVKIHIYVPCINETYNFSLEENERVSSLIGEVSLLAEEKKEDSGKGEGRDYLLVSQSHGCILNPDKTLAYYDIRNGDSLILI